MALEGTLTHRKTRRLARELGIPQWGALGLMEALWSVTRRQCPDGAIGSMSDEDLAAEIYFDGDAGELVAALVAAQLVDVDARHRLIVHGWHEHSDDTTDVKLARNTRRYACGAMPRMKRLAQGERERILARYGEPCADVAQRGTESHNGALPVPEPVPEPVPNTPLPPASGGPCVEWPEAEPGEGVAERGREPAHRSPRGRAAALEREIAAMTPELRAGVRLVAEACGVSDERLWPAIGRALEASVRAGPGELREAIGFAVRRVGEYRQCGPMLRFAVGWPKFFEAGVWLNPQLWPMDRQAEAAGARARVGMGRL